MSFDYIYQLLTAIGANFHNYVCHVVDTNERRNAIALYVNNRKVTMFFDGDDILNKVIDY